MKAGHHPMPAAVAATDLVVVNLTAAFVNFVPRAAANLQNLNFDEWAVVNWQNFAAVHFAGFVDAAVVAVVVEMVGVEVVDFAVNFEEVNLGVVGFGGLVN